MNNSLQLARFPLLLASACLLGAYAAPAAGVAASREAAVGRVVGVEVNHGDLIAEFPDVRMNVAADKRELGWYIVGDQIRIDRFGRPLQRQTAR